MNCVTRAYCEIDGLQLHYRAAGDCERPVLVLFHQAPSTSKMYEPLMQNLAEDYYLLAPDMPGFGGSDAMEEGCDIALFAAHFHSWLQQLGVETCLMFGHHTGAAVAVQMASDKPDLCLSLAMSGPPLLTQEQRQALPAMASPFPVEEQGAHLLAMWHRIRAKDPDAPLELIQREVLSALNSGDDYQAAYRAVCRQDFASQLKLLRCPVLVFAGGEDPLVDAIPATMDLLHNGYTAAMPAAARTYACERQAEVVAENLHHFFTSQALQE